MSETASVEQFQIIQQERDELKKQFEEFRNKQLQKDVTAKIDACCTAGKLPPAEKENAIKIALSLPEEHRQAYFAQLESLTPLIDARVLATAGPSSSAGVSPLAQVQQYAAKHKLNFEQAVIALQKENPQLIAQLQRSNNG